MKKLLMIILMGAVVAPIFAQYQSQRERSRYNRRGTEQYYGLRLGLNVASLSSDAVDLDMDSRTGLSVGAVYGLQLTNSTPIWLELGAFYSEKGGETHVQGEHTTCRLGYLQVPIVIKYSFDVYDDLYVQPFLGGYLGLGISGKTKNYGTRESSSSFDQFNRFDGGLRIGCGVEYQMLYAEVGFDFGLANINKSDFDTVHNRNFFAAIGVNF